ncbi:hypothetical protein [Nocardia cyriacigeorgica]|uniref:Uncharacterized protein n=1 Tax=Nocardia cyriacigeorgica TaxID=135487 RepID=A0A4U8VZR3_9NOCA|nr:hypothetical protein [Nocardia cyriacigeorgica]VFA97564.1 Uncharacterised protein [Nocardia cyriacigeorgica]
MLLLDPDIEQQLFAEMGNGEVDRQRQCAPDYPQRHWTTKGGRRHVVLTWLIGSGHAPMWRGCPPSRGGAGSPCADGTVNATISAIRVRAPIGCWEAPTAADVRFEWPVKRPQWYVPRHDDIGGLFESARRAR